MISINCNVYKTLLRFSAPPLSAWLPLAVSGAIPAAPGCPWLPPYFLAIPQGAPRLPLAAQGFFM
jgi:hypothetical protein